jgi:hypothetical protein
MERSCSVVPVDAGGMRQGRALPVFARICQNAAPAKPGRLRGQMLRLRAGLGWN